MAGIDRMAADEPAPLEHAVTGATNIKLKRRPAVRPFGADPAMRRRLPLT